MFGSGGKSSSPGPHKDGNAVRRGTSPFDSPAQVFDSTGDPDAPSLQHPATGRGARRFCESVGLSLGLDGRKEGREGGREEGKRCHADDGHQTRSYATVPPQQTDGWSGPGQLQSCSEVSARTGRQHRMWKLRMLRLRRPLSLPCVRKPLHQEDLISLQTPEGSC